MWFSARFQISTSALCKIIFLIWPYHILLDINVWLCTWLVLALNIEACDWAVAIETHSPTQCNGPVLHFSDLHLWGVWGLYKAQSWQTLCYFCIKIKWQCTNICNWCEGWIVGFSLSSWSGCSYTLNCELNDSSVFTKRVDGMAGEEARVLPHCGHDLMDAQEGQEFRNELMQKIIHKWISTDPLVKKC